MALLRGLFSAGAPLRGLVSSARHAGTNVHLFGLPVLSTPGFSSAMASNHAFLKSLGITEDNAGVYHGTWSKGSGETHTSVNPTTGEPIAKVSWGNKDDYEKCVAATQSAAKEWAATPAPRRGEIVRQIGDALRTHLDDLGAIVSLEMGKIRPEGVGEVQEFVDICDFAVGLSRTMNGQVIPSERPDHVLLETWNPIGTVGIITAFNFPVAVAGWNLALSLVAGNTHVWKGAPSASLSSVATMKVIADVLERNGVPPGVVTLCQGGNDVGEAMSSDPRLPLLSFTGSTAVGKRVASTVAGRLGRTILELGGNNAVVVLDDADLKLAVAATAFAGVGTCGQRCTSARRAIVTPAVKDQFVSALKSAYSSVRLGDPLESGTLVGPLHNAAAVSKYNAAVEAALSQGGTLVTGGKVRSDVGPNFVEPTIIEIDSSAPIVQEETFAPIIYIMTAKDIDEAIDINNSVAQGLSASLFTNNMKNVFKWVGPNGADTGLVNVNAGTSGAEIGGAFGGNKETGGGRESGSDAWKQYCRRGTATINYGNDLPLAQGIKFE